MAEFLEMLEAGLRMILAFINNGAGLLLSIKILDFPLLGWAGAGAIVTNFIAFFGDEDGEEE